MLWALGSGIPAIADDTELFLSDSSQASSTVRPNILFILDTSGSMNTEVITQATFNSTVTYNGNCSPDRVYWRRGTGDPPSCGTRRWFNRSALMCDLAVQAFTSGAGRYTDRMAQYDPGNDDRWEELHRDQKSRLVECEDDRGVHGDGSSGNSNFYASDALVTPKVL